MGNAANKQDIDWDTIEDLGNVFDKELAERLGVSTKEVFRARKARKIPPYKGKPKRGGRRSKIDWSQEPLGRETDSSIAYRLGVTPSAVAAQRRKRGIKSSKPTGRTNVPFDIMALNLGDEPDAVIAKRVGLTSQTIAAYRKKLGIESYRSKRIHNIDWKSIEDLATTPRSVLAKRLGVHPSIVKYHQNRLGLRAPAVDKGEQYFRAAQSIRQHNTRKNQTYAARLTDQLTSSMGMTLTQICKHLKLSPSLVSAFRSGREDALGPSGRFRTTARSFAAIYGLAPNQIWIEEDPLTYVTDGTDGLENMEATWGNPEESIRGTRFLDLLPDVMASVLTEREADIIKRRFSNPPETLNQVGERYDVSRERIRQLEWQAIQKLKAAYGVDVPTPGLSKIKAEKKSENKKAKKRKKRYSKRGSDYVTISSRILSIFQSKPNQTFHADALASRSKEWDSTRGTIYGTVLRLADNGQLKRVSRGVYQFARKTPAPKKKKKKRGPFGWQAILDLIDGSPDKIFTRKEIILAMRKLGFTNATTSMYLSRLNTNDKIQNPGWGLYQSILAKKDEPDEK